MIPSGTLPGIGIAEVPVAIAVDVCLACRVGDAGKYGLIALSAALAGEGTSGTRTGAERASGGAGEGVEGASLLIAPSAFAPARGEARPPSTCCHFRPPGTGTVVGTDCGAEGEAEVEAEVSFVHLLGGVDTARWWFVVVAVVGTGAAGVNDSLLRSGSSSDFRRRGEPERLPDGEVGLEDCGDICAGREGIGRRRFGCLPVELDDDAPA